MEGELVNANLYSKKIRKKKLGPNSVPPKSRNRGNTTQKRNGHWQARVRKINQHVTKTFINKIDAERWAKQIEVEMQKGSYTNLVLAERTTFTEIIERYIVEVLLTMRGGKAICQFYGGKSMGPRTKEGKNCIRAAHWKHGEETQISKAERSAKSVMFRYLTDIGNHVNLFYTQLKTQGRPPSGYAQLDLTDPEQFAIEILKHSQINSQALLGGILMP